MKVPLGVLLPEKETTKQNIQRYLPKNYFIITVGDRTTEKMLEFGLTPSLQIIDNLEKRKKRIPPKSSEITTNLNVDNPPAEITTQSITTIKKAFLIDPPVRIIVNGEEDLLVLPACLFAPENSVVLYGQPNEGLIIVKVTPEIRNKTKSLLDLME